MSLKREYQKEVEEITHSPELDRVLFERLEQTTSLSSGVKKARKKSSKRKFVAAAAIAIAVLVGSNQAALTEAASWAIGYFSLHIGNERTMEMAKSNPRTLDYDSFCRKNGVMGPIGDEDGYAYIYLDNVDTFYEYTGIRYPKCSDYEMPVLLIDLGRNGIGHVSIDISENGRECAHLNGHFLTTEASEEKFLGTGDRSAKIEKVYTYDDGSKGYLARSMETGTYEIYFCKDDIQYVLYSSDRETAEKIVDWLVN